MAACKICGNDADNKIFKVPEMLRGTRQQFDYLECSACGCLALAAIPEDMSRYYANDTYGSFSVSERNPLKKMARVLRNKAAILGKGGPIGHLLNLLTPIPPDYRVIGPYAALDSRILDVGCGVGSYINDLASVGFKNVLGVDPYLEKDIAYPSGAMVRKMPVRDVHESYDVVLSHHSFEHVPDPLETLSAIRRILAPNGVCLLTMPMAEELYRRFGKDAYIIQAPQHFFLYSIKGFGLLAQKAGLKIEKTMRFTKATENWYKCSMLWRRDVVCPDAGKALDALLTLEEKEEIASIEAELAAQGKGDNVTFVLRHGD